MLYASETFVNATTNVRYGESGVQETFTDEPGELFRRLQREYGRCVSRIYVDPKEGGQPKAIGWVFQSRQQYEDWNGRGERYYLREVWVTLHDAPDTVTRKAHYHYMRSPS